MVNFFQDSKIISAMVYFCTLGIGGALGYTASMVVVGFNFKKRLNLALGFALCGIGVGICAMAPIMQFARDYYGTTGFFIILATCALNIITFGTMCFPSKLETDAQVKRRFQARIQEVSTCRKSKILAVAHNYIQILLNKGVLCLCFAMFNFCLGTFVIYLHLPTYIVTCGFTHLEASFFVAISGILTVFGRLMTGVIANLNCIPDAYLFSGSMGIVSIATFLLPNYALFYWGQILYAILLGLFFGSCYVVLTSVNIQLVGIAYMSAAIGLEFFFGGIGALVGPVFAGVIVDSGASYDHSFYIAASCILLATVSSASTSCLTNSEPGNDFTDVEVEIQNDKNIVLKDSVHKNELNHMSRESSANSDKV